MRPDRHGGEFTLPDRAVASFRARRISAWTAVLWLERADHPTRNEGDLACQALSAEEGGASGALLLGEWEGSTSTERTYPHRQDGDTGGTLVDALEIVPAE
jgi:hypothetical protein